MTGIEEAVQRAIDAGSYIYNRKSTCPDNERDAELRNLYNLALMAPDGAASEIGVKCGGSFLCWSCARDGRGNLYAIDDWSTKTEFEFYENIKLYNIITFVYPVKSWEAAGMIGEEFAFVFIDGDHQAGIIEDIKVWPAKIMPGGIIAFHDYGVWKESVNVRRAVDKWNKKANWEKLPQVGSTVAFRRPG